MLQRASPHTLLSSCAVLWMEAHGLDHHLQHPQHQRKVELRVTGQCLLAAHYRYTEAERAFLKHTPETASSEDDMALAHRLHLHKGVVENLVLAFDADSDPKAYAESFDRLAAWVDNSLDVYRVRSRVVVFDDGAASPVSAGGGGGGGGVPCEVMLLSSCKMCVCCVCVCVCVRFTWGEMQWPSSCGCAGGGRGGGRYGPWLADDDDFRGVYSGVQGRGGMWAGQ